MTCFHPITAFRGALNPKTGLRAIVFNPSNGSMDDCLKIPCGQCLGCRLEKARQWAIRIMHESQEAGTSRFLTLTYNNEHLPKNASLNKRDIVLFMKKLRKYMDKYQINVRFFQCGEYGENLSRPHHHVALFLSSANGNERNLRELCERRFGLFGDEIKLDRRTNPQHVLYTSMTLEKMWGNGFVTIGQLTEDSASYVAKYVTKKMNGAKAPYHYGKRMPEYVTMSRRPGIGREWLLKYANDVKAIDGCLSKNFRLKPPRYYDNLYDVIDPEDLKLRKEKRIANVKELSHLQLKAKEKLLKTRYKEFKRSFENESKAL